MSNIHSRIGVGGRSVSARRSDGFRAAVTSVVEALELRTMFAADLPFVSVSVIDGQASEVGRDPGTLRIERTGPTDSALKVQLQPGGGTACFQGLNTPNNPQYPDNPFDCDVTTLGQDGITATIPAGASFVDVVITPRTDTLTEGDEFFSLTVIDSWTSPGSYTFTPYARPQVVITDRPSPQEITIEAPDSEASEDGDNPAFFLVKRTGDLSQRTRISFNRAGTLGYEDATNGGPVEAIFDPGESERLLFISPHADDVVEGTETLTLSPIPFGPVTIGAESSATISVADGALWPQVTLTPIADAWVGAGTEANNNHGSDAYLQLSDSKYDGDRQILLKFDISSVPSVAEATLELSAEWEGKTGSFGYFTASGVPGAVWTENGVTYNNRPVEPLWTGHPSGVGSPPYGYKTLSIWMNDFVQRQKLLGENTITILLTADSPLFPSPDGFVARIGGREGPMPARLIITPESDRNITILDVSHRKLTVTEGGTATAYTYTPDGSPWTNIDIMKVPGGDPDINVTENVIRYSTVGDGLTPRSITFVATPDSDTVNGSASFVVSVNGAPRVITVFESDTGINTPPTDPSSLTVSVTAAGFAQNGSGATGGINDTLKVKNTSDNKGEQESFLELDLSSLPSADQIGSATLQVYGASGNIAAAGSMSTRAATPPVAVSAYAANNTDWYWDESSLSWSTRPAAGGAAVSSQTVGAQGWYSFDLASLVRSAKAAGRKSISIALKGAASGTTSAVFDSDEAAANRPKLVVTKQVSTTSVSLRATADAHVRDGASAGTNYGAATNMEVKKSATADSSRETYLKFDLSQFSSASQIQSAKLRLYSKLAAAGGGVALSIVPVSDTTWTESGIKWSNRPAVGTAIGSVSVSSTTAGYKELDVTAYLKQLKQAGKTTAGFAVRATTAEGQIVQITSDEASANRPELRVAKVVATPSYKSLRAAADTHLRDGTYASQNFGGATTLEVKKSSVLGSTRQTWLRFDVSSITTISSAKLRLYGHAATSTAAAVQLSSSATTTWGEASLTYGNKPTIGAAIGTFSVSGTTNKWYEIDVMAFLKAQKSAGKTAVTFVLAGVNTADPLATFNSDEAASNRPELRVS